MRLAVWIFQNGRRPPSWMWSNRKWRRSIRRSRKPRPRSKHEGVRM